MKTKDIRIFNDADYNTGPLNWNRIEKLMIKTALTRSSGKKNNASILLGIAERTLFRKIIQHSIHKKYGTPVYK